MQHYELRMLPLPGAPSSPRPTRPAGALITYFLREDPPPPPKPAESVAPPAPGTTGTPARPPTRNRPSRRVKVTITAPDGSVVRELEGPDRRGSTALRGTSAIRFRSRRSRPTKGGSASPKGPSCCPGQYTVRLRARGQDLSQKVTVRVDPRARTTPAALEARFKASRSVTELQRAFVDADALGQSMHDELERMRKLLKDGPEHAALKSAHEALSKKVTEARDRIKGGWGGPRFRIFDLAGQLQASTAAPTDAQARSLEQLTADVTAAVGTLNTIATVDFPAFEKTAAGVLSAVLKPVKAPGK